MATEENYNTKRQLKAITSHGKRHKSTVVGNMVGIFPGKLVDYTASRGRSGKKAPHITDMLEDMTISIDLDVEDISQCDDFICSLTSIVGLDRIEKDFEVLSTGEKVVRALKKAKFKNVVSMELDGDEIYHCPEDYYDSDEAIKQLINELSAPERSGNEITITLISKDHSDCIVKVKISRYHMRWMHDILVTFHGMLSEKYFRRVMNYLEDNLDIENIEDEWTKARHFGT